MFRTMFKKILLQEYPLCLFGSTLKINDFERNEGAVRKTMPKSTPELASRMNDSQLSKPFKYLTELTPKEKRDFFDSFDVIFCDCDGVIWESLREELPGAPEAIVYLKRQGKQVIYVTNNSIIPIEVQLRKFANCGIEVEKCDIVHPAQTICDHLKSIQFDGLIFCLASNAFKSLLREAGFEVVEECVTFVHSVDDLRAAIHSNDPVKAVIIDVDFNLTAPKMMRAHWHLKNNPECLFIGGAADTLITVDGKDVIGPGPYISVVENTSKRQPLILGKPGMALRDALMRKEHLQNPRRGLFIGDSLVTDVRFGKMCGFQTLLVLSGSTKREDLESTLLDIEMPDYVVDGLADLNGFLP
ncbi:PREDICTED: 4-nitrophenylphosphatase isoform X1 [Rhagoletis zephyria]|uniref:4-nitrophenylphosphatase isoform X1 n=1 Tax=Rhagoletis zephyria TaxID=28612 RepID=UPI0008116D71|nr:PREDICTED: 4-nitrophenylphosphatase isoform X1 [Rhagoletis zephyria]